MTLIEQMLNIQEYGDKGGQMNLQRVRQELIDHNQEKKKKKTEQQEIMTLIERVFIDTVKASGKAVVKQAIDGLFDDFNKGNW